MKEISPGSKENVRLGQTMYTVGVRYEPFFSDPDEPVADPAEKAAVMRIEGIGLRGLKRGRGALPPRLMTTKLNEAQLADCECAGMRSRRRAPDRANDPSGLSGYAGRQSLFPLCTL